MTFLPQAHKCDEYIYLNEDVKDNSDGILICFLLII